MIVSFFFEFETRALQFWIKGIQLLWGLSLHWLSWLNDHGDWHAPGGIG